MMKAEKASSGAFSGYIAIKLRNLSKNSTFICTIQKKAVLLHREKCMTNKNAHL